MRRLIPAALSVVLILSTAPVFAGPSEDAFLAKLPGTWTGKGTISGAESGVIECTLTMRQRDEGISFRSKCDVPQYGPQSFSGSIAYNDKAGQYEAKSPSGDVSVGVKKGSSIVFTGKMKGIAVGTSILTISTSRIVVDSTVRRPGGSGGEIKSHVEMKR
jgi:hypothetical protein